jgi:hypothetical protein
MERHVGPSVTIFRGKRALYISNRYGISKPPETLSYKFNLAAVIRL